MGTHLQNLFASSRAAAIKRLPAYFPSPLRRYGQTSKESNGQMEKAPTTAEEFERVAEEFERVAEAKARQGFASDQTVEKARDGNEEASLGDSMIESVKEKCKKPGGKSSFHKTGYE